MTIREISKTEAARYMGVRGILDDKTAELLDKYEPIVRDALRPAYVYREAETEFRPNGVYLAGLGVPLEGNSIRGLLTGCRRAIVMAATVSAEADRLISRISVSDMAGALAVDCLCSAAIEQVCDLAEEEIFSHAKAENRTMRFSPGYGDLPINVQPELLRYLNAQRRIGLTCGESCMLIPTKSVTAIIGVSDDSVHKQKSGCGICSMRESCSFRNSGDCKF